jgi:hypothetical protein
MRWTILVSTLVVACSAQHLPVSRNESAPRTDAGTTSADPVDAGATNNDTSDAAVAAASDGGSIPLDAGPQRPPPATLNAVPPPDSTQQSEGWTVTGADGCDDLVPSQLPPRLSWSAPDSGCWQPTVDGEGNLAANFGSARQIDALLFLPRNGSSGAVAEYDVNLYLAPRATGFYVDQQDLGAGDWFGPVTPAGMQEASPEFIEGWGSLLEPDPRGGFVEERDRLAPNSTGRLTHYFELRWLDDALNARTDWHVVTSWPAGPPGDNAHAWIDVSGRAFVLHYFNARLPCPGTHFADGFWASEDGATIQFTPFLPMAPGGGNCYPDIVWSGPALPLDEGGFALFSSAGDQTGWFAWYPGGSGTSVAAPSWLTSYQGSLQRLTNGAYLATQRDSATCQRIAQIIGPAGQLCASVALNGSEDCSARDSLSPDGTLVLAAPSGCSLTWWPGLGRAR